jgi:hypothetical protein
MPTTPDRPASSAGRSTDPEDPDAPDGGHLSARETVPIDVRPRAPRDSQEQGREPRPQDRETVRIDVGRPGPGGSGLGGPGGSGLGGPGGGAGDIDNRETVHLPVRQGHPGGPGRRGRRGRAPLVVAVAFAAIWAALLSYLPVAVVMWLARSMEGTGGLLGAARVGLGAWLLGHGVPLGTSVGPVALAPLLLTLLAAWRLSRAGVHVTRAIGARGSGSPTAAVTVAAAIGIAYGVLGVLAAAAVDGPGTVVSVPRAGVTFAGFGAAAALAGALISTGAVAVLARRTPDPVRHGVRTGAVAVLLVLAAGAGFTGLSVAIGGGQAAEMIGAYRTGVAGQAGITLVSLAYGGNAAIWAAAYLLGPGFLLGAGTTVSLTEVVVGPLPTVPLLAGLPDGPVGAAGAGLLAFPVIAGMAAGWMLTRRLVRTRQAARNAAARPGGPGPAGPGWTGLLAAAALAGPVAGLLLGLLASVSGGALGAGRLARIGPVPWQVAAVATAVVGVSALIGAAVSRAFRVHTQD